jgi:hypothetical protein
MGGKGGKKGGGLDSIVVIVDTVVCCDCLGLSLSLIM